MAEEEKDTLGADAAAAAGPAPAEPKGPLLLALANTVFILATLGFFVYSKLLFKRPPITEEGERERIAAAKDAPHAIDNPGLIHFDAMTVNIRANPAQPKSADGTAEQIQGKMHYATISFSLEVRDMARKDDVDELKPIILDKMLSMIGRKTYPELVTVQGRYLLRTELLELINSIFNSGSETENKSAVVTNVYLTQFIVQ